MPLVVDGFLVFGVLFGGSFLSVETEFAWVAIVDGVDDSDVGCELASAGEVEGDVRSVGLTVGVDVFSGFLGAADAVGATDLHDVVLDVLVTIIIEILVDGITAHDVLEKRKLVFGDVELLFSEESEVSVAERSFTQASGEWRLFISEGVRNQSTANRKSYLVDVGFEGAEAGWRTILSPVAVMQAFR